MFSLSKSFENAHGFRLKSTFAETLTHLLHSIGKVSYLLVPPLRLILTIQ
jgi:furry protein family